jgi:hypothetical protein
VPVPSEAIGPATLALTQTVGAFQFFLPRLSDVRKASMKDSPDIIGDVRFGEVAAGALCLGMGAIVSSMTGSPYPAIVSVLMMLVLVCVYEAALRGDRPFNPLAPVVRSDDA